jgi:hypothetical protein
MGPNFMAAHHEIHAENPKYVQAQKDGKAPLERLERAADEPISRVLQHGAEKYGARNWRRDAIRITTYVAAVRRHIAALNDGEDIDPDSGEHHMAHIGANVHVFLDALAHGTLIDDRPSIDAGGTVDA